MNKNRSFRKLPGIASVIAIIGTFTACAEKDPIKPEQEKWIEVMEETYPGDDFEYICHEREIFNTIVDSTICVRSVKFPGETIWISEDGEGRLISNYADILYEDAVDKYYEDKISAYIDCDEISVSYIFNDRHYVEDISAKDYIEQNATHNYYVKLYYDEGHEYPDRDEIVNDILRYLSQADYYDGALNFYRKGCDERDFRVEILFTKDGILRDLSWYEGTDGDRERLVNMQNLEEVLKERGIE